MSIMANTYDGLGRRIKKVLTNSGDSDGSALYYCNKNRAIERRDGFENVAAQIVHRTKSAMKSKQGCQDELALA